LEHDIGLKEFEMGRKIGFENAVVSRVFCTLTFFITIMSLSSQNFPQSHTDAHRLSGSLWNLISRFFAFSSPSELFVGLSLMYTFRVFERQMGSGKFMLFMALVAAVGKALEHGFLSLAGGLRVAPGPYSAIYACFILYYGTVPSLSSTSSTIAQLLNDKTFTYLLGAQLLYSQGRASVVPALAGFGAGLLYRCHFLYLDQLVLPPPIRKVFQAVHRLLLVLFPEAPHVDPRSAGQAPYAVHPSLLDQQNLNQGSIGQGERLIDGQGFNFGVIRPNIRQRNVSAQPLAVSEEHIVTLMGLGFERSAVVRALQLTGNNVDAAANRLYSGLN